MKIKSSIKRSVLGPIKEKFSPQCIRLAVVGNTSSGKSFLLKDIIDALRSMGCGFFAGQMRSADPETRRVGMVVLLFMPAGMKTITANW